MAREAQDREDLLRDATAFVERAQLSLCGEAGSVEVFIGFRNSGAASFYFDQDPVYHFNNHGKLRRAFVDDRLIKAEKGKLVALQRQSSENQVTMVRHTLNTEEQQLFCQSVAQQLNNLRLKIFAGKYTLDGQVTNNKNKSMVEYIATFLEQLRSVEIADSPRVGG